MIKRNIFGKTKDGRDVFCFTLADKEGYVKILNYGGIIQSLVVPNKAGTPTDVVLGYTKIEDYENNDGYLGALIGRFGNRIGGGKLTIDGKQYQLYCNDKGNHLHGGKVGLDKKLWKSEIHGDALTLSITLPDGEENYPGDLQVRVTYTFREGGLKIRYYAVSNQKTVISLTNHAYFNLNGEGVGDVKDVVLSLDSDFITPTDDNLVPIGGFREVKGTPFDFTQPKAIGRDINIRDDDLQKGNGFDHCYLLKNDGRTCVQYATAYSPITGITMTCFTDMPAVHFYSGNFLGQQGKGGYYPKNGGFCLETEAIPNNVNVPEYAQKSNSIYDAGQEYQFTATYKFKA